VLVTLVMCLVMVSEAGYGAANGGLGEVPVVVALAVLPLLYVVRATRPLWLRHRYLLLGVQAALTYVPFAWLGTNWAPSGWLAGLVLLTVPSPASWFVTAILAALEAAVWSGMVVALPNQSTTLESLGGMLFLTVESAALGLLVHGLTRLAWLAVRLENLRGELARKAVAGERLRVARDTHDLLGLGLSAIAMKADLIGKLIGRDDARAGEEIAELARISATARADVRLVAGEARDLPLDAELAAARDVLASAGIDVRMRVSADPSPEAAAVLVPVVREAVTNILKHSSASYCVLEMTADARLLRLSISNRAAAVIPSSPGRSMSSTARSGRSASAAGTMSVPAATWATTLMSSSRFSTETSVSRSIRMSSATSTRIIIPPAGRTTAVSPGRHDRPTRCSPPRPRASPAPSPSSRRPAGCRSARAARP
jgi:two-component system, NarL family, sensor histidine kinase DesK